MERETKQGPEWMSLPDASQVSGASIGTLLGWVRDDLIESQITDGPEGRRCLVRIEEVLERADRSRGSESTPASETDSPQGGTSGSEGESSREATRAGSNELLPLMKALPELIRELGDARERAARAETKVEFLTQRLAELKNRPPERVQEAPQHEIPLPTPPAAPEEDDSDESWNDGIEAALANLERQADARSGGDLEPALPAATSIGPGSSLEGVWDDHEGEMDEPLSLGNGRAREAYDSGMGRSEKRSRWRRQKRH